MTRPKTKRHAFPTDRDLRRLWFETAWGQGGLVYTPDGSLGGFGSGCEIKQKMIAMEAATSGNRYF